MLNFGLPCDRPRAGQHAAAWAQIGLILADRAPLNAVRSRWILAHYPSVSPPGQSRPMGPVDACGSPAIRYLASPASPIRNGPSNLVGTNSRGIVRTSAFRLSLISGRAALPGKQSCGFGGPPKDRVHLRRSAQKVSASLRATRPGVPG